MANRAHVPKFGDWNNQSQPFTAVFDNARTNKRADLYESLENSDIKTQAKPPPQQPTPIIPKPVRAPPPTDINKVRAPPANQLYGARGGLYGGYGGGGGSGNQRQPQVPPRPPQTQPKPNVRGGNNGRGGTTIPPFPGSVGSGDQNMSYTHIFDQVKEERRDARSNGGSVGNTPSRLINDDQRSRDQSTAPGSFKLRERGQDSNKGGLSMSSRSERVVTRSSRRSNNVNGTQQSEQPRAGQQPPIVSGPPTIDVDAIEDDDDVVESTASAFDRAKRHKSGGSQRGPLVVDVESGGTTRLSKNRTKRQSDQANVDHNNPRKSKTVAPPVEEPKFNCPICMCPFTEEVSTKCGHIFCKKCIKLAVSVQAKCPTCRKRVIAKDLIRVFLPTTR
ncbi:unnamed protein product [Brassica rapa subsp. narinosa]